MKTKLLEVLMAYRALAKVVDSLVQTWSEQPDVRNRPGRQRLSSALVGLVPRPLALGSAVDAIAKECEIDLDEAQARVAVVERARLVIIESPFAASTPEGIDANITYARACVRDSLSRGEAPIASHLLYTQEGVLRDTVPHERQWGVDAGLAWRRVADATVVYTDRGVSHGMDYGVAAARQAGRVVEFRTLPKQ
jgi:hypothetical protein